jgi:hypothetical protein
MQAVAGKIADPCEAAFKKAIPSLADTSRVSTRQEVDKAGGLVDKLSFYPLALATLDSIE